MLGKKEQKTKMQNTKKLPVYFRVTSDDSFWIWVIPAGVALLEKFLWRDGSMFQIKDSNPGKKTLIIKDWTSKGTVIPALTICKSWFRPQQS